MVRVSHRHPTSSRPLVPPGGLLRLGDDLTSLMGRERGTLVASYVLEHRWSRRSVEPSALCTEWFASRAGAPVLALDVVACVAVGVVVVDVRLDRMPGRFLCHDLASFLFLWP